MKWIVLAALCLVVLFSGCVEQKETPKSEPVQGGNLDKITVTITSPKAGEILQGKNEFEFASSVQGGKSPYSYSWSSNIDGVLSTQPSFRQNPAKLGKGGHVIILKVTDSKGSSGQGSVLIESM